MDFRRTRDVDAVRRILTHPKTYPMIGDDYAPADRMQFQVNLHPEIWYVMVRNADFRKIGLFSLFPQNRICWEVHVVMLPEIKTSEKWAAARQLVPWLAANTECRHLTAAVPASNWPAIIYGTHGIGMHYVGRHDAAFMKHGKLQDLVLLGLSIGS